VVIEAESHADNLTRNGRTWTRVSSPAGASGEAAMQVLPNGGTSFGSSTFPSTSPRMSYPVQFAAAGTFTVWTRGFGATTADDSAHAGLDGALVATARDLTFGALNRWAWSDRQLGGAVATITVPSAGLHTIDIWMREDGAAIDKLILTRTAISPSGTGPAESPRAP
jgi:hypothetical protein